MSVKNPLLGSKAALSSWLRNSLNRPPPSMPASSRPERSHGDLTYALEIHIFFPYLRRSPTELSFSASGLPRCLGSVCQRRPHRCNFCATELGFDGLCPNMLEGVRIFGPAHMQVDGRALKKVDSITLLLLLLSLYQALKVFT